MKLHSRDQRCRFIPAVGTQTDHASAFGTFLKEMGINLPSDCSLQYMVSRQWITPVLRVELPRAALEAWTNYPQLSMRVDNDCPDTDTWALDLYANAVVSPRPPSSNNDKWWMCFLDDPTNPLSCVARAHSVNPVDHAATPAPFTHSSSGRQLRPWIDYFAYWQAFQIAELLESLTYRLPLGCMDIAAIQSSEQRIQSEAHQQATAIVNRWRGRSQTFEWVSRVRTLLSAWSVSDRDWSEACAVARRMADEQHLDASSVALGLREVLLVMSREYNDKVGAPRPGYAELRGLLRQDIEYTLCFIEMLTGEEVDCLDGRWHYDRPAQPWARLVDALPKEVWVARLHFSRTAKMYLGNLRPSSCRELILEDDAIDALLQRHWSQCYALRRFCLALFRLHEELRRGEDLCSPISIIPAAERIEQLLLTTLHAERVLAFVHRSRPDHERHPDVGSLTRGALDRALIRMRVSSGTRRLAVRSARDLIASRGKLHERELSASALFVSESEIATNSDDANHLAAAHVNFVIARNYAAHHDQLDDAFIYPGDQIASEHIGQVAVSSTLLVVLTALRRVDRH